MKIDSMKRETKQVPRHNERNNLGKIILDIIPQAVHHIAETGDLIIESRPVLGKKRFQLIICRKEVQEGSPYRKMRKQHLRD